MSLSNIQQLAEMADINFILNSGLAYTYTCSTWREGSYSFPTELKMSKPLVNAKENTNSSKSTVVKACIIICRWISLQLYSTEYMSYDLGIFDDSVHGHNVACSVCLVPRSTAVSITMDFYVVTYISCQNQNVYFWSSHLFWQVWAKLEDLLSISFSVRAMKFIGQRVLQVNKYTATCTL